MRSSRKLYPFVGMGFRPIRRWLSGLSTTAKPDPVPLTSSTTDQSTRESVDRLHAKDRIGKQPTIDPTPVDSCQPCVRTHRWLTSNGWTHSGLACISNLAKCSASVGPLRSTACIGWPPRYTNDAQRTSPTSRTHAGHTFTRGGCPLSLNVDARTEGLVADIDRSTRARNVCTLVCTRCPENLGNFTMSRFSRRGVGVWTIGHGVSSSLARLISIVFREIRKGTALLANSNTHNPKSLYGLNRRLPETRRASTPTSTSPIPTSAPTGPLSRFAMCTTLNAQRSFPNTN
jgi:hypothetical protein